MPWFTVLKGLLNLAGSIAKYMADKQLLDAGEYKAIAKYNADALEKIRLAAAARAAVKHDADSVSNDPNNRD